METIRFPLSPLIIKIIIFLCMKIKQEKKYYIIVKKIQTFNNAGCLS